MAKRLSFIFVCFHYLIFLVFPNINEMNDRSYESIFSNYDFVLVYFYVPWCNPCHRVTQEFEKASIRIKSLEQSISLVKVNAAENPFLKQKFNINEYPTFKFFAVGVELPYKGGDTEEEIFKWMRFRAFSSTKKLNSLQELEELQSNNEIIIVYIGLKDESFEIFNKITKTYEDLSFAHYFIDSKTEDNKFNEVFVIKNEIKTIYKPEKFNFHELRAFIEKNQKGIILPLDKYHAYKIFDENKPGLVLLIDDSLKSDQALDNLKTALNENLEIKSEFIAYFGNYNEEYSRTFMKLFEINQQDLPQIRIVNPRKNSKNVDKFEPPNLTLLTSSYISLFCELFKAGSLKKLLKSQPIPTNNNNKVKEIVGKNFELIVFDDKKDVLVNFYARWCNHCQFFERIFNDLAEKIAFNDNILLVKIDASENEVDGIEIKAYPTIKFFPAKSKKTPIDYNGNRDLQNLLEFLQTHSSFPWPNFQNQQKFTNEPVELNLINFEDVVFNLNQSVLVNFYALQCSYCRHLDPTYKQLVSEAKKNGLDLVIARIDGIKYRTDKIKIKGFPTVMLFKKNQKDKPIEYSGDRSLEDFMKFLISNAGLVKKDNIIIEISESNFRTEVYDEEYDFLMYFFNEHEDDEHYNVLLNLAKQFKNENREIKVGKFNLSNNKIHKDLNFYIEKSKLPNIFLFIRRSKKKPIAFQGDLNNFDEVLAYISEGTNLDLTGNSGKKNNCMGKECKEEL